MYALTGANGHLGRLVIKHLLAQVPANQIIAQVITKGVPADAARSTLRLISWIAHAAAETPTDTVEQASGTKPTSIDPILRTLATVSDDVEGFREG
jgi:thioester reductase-like protein